MRDDTCPGCRKQAAALDGGVCEHCMLYGAPLLPAQPFEGLEPLIITGDATDPYARPVAFWPRVPVGGGGDLTFLGLDEAPGLQTYTALDIALPEIQPKILARGARMDDEPLPPHTFMNRRARRRADAVNRGKR